MIRKLLACLALLTGLTAASGPVHAEVAVALASGIEASSAGAAAAHTPAVAASLLTLPGRWFALALSAAPAKSAAATVLTVYIGSDRARE